MASLDKTEVPVSFSGLSDDRSKALLSILGEAVTSAHDIVSSSKLAPRSKPLKSLSLMILHNMAEKGESVHQLASKGMSAGIEAIVRSMFESYVDLQNLHSYPDHYPNYLFAVVALNQRKQIEIAIKNPEWHWSALSRLEAASFAGSTLEDFQAQMVGEVNYLKRNLSDQFFRDTDRKRLETRIEVRAEWAGLHDKYDQDYRYLSAVSHSDMIDVTPKTQEHVSAWWPPERRPCSSAAVWAAATYLIEAIDKVTKKLKLRRHKLIALERRLEDWLGGGEK
tara:strand:+ start:18182 stop:19021 length:840 start_codon:yes stop_codon:yes gene_type:complete